ncbi:MAG TPA: pilus assembly protein CpaF [Acetobacteraceae bacterium]|jgi:pilus assembly protein CpaF|nr:pilus assembly protein CpaF [Acetobacteraceae bacterium]
MKIFGKRALQPNEELTETELLVTAPATPLPVAEDKGLRERVLREIDPAAAADVPPALLRQQIERIVHEIATQDRIELSAREQQRVAEELANDMVGYGPLEAVLRDDQVTDIMVNGPTNIFIERRGKLERATIRFRDNQHIATIAQKIAAQVGRRIDEASPMVDARLPDGSRVNVIFPPLAIDSPCISIRKFSKRSLTLQDMTAIGSLTGGVARLLEIAARCRLNLLISGGTGSGKTTLMNALSRGIDHAERIITVEDAAELRLQQPHVIRLETRPVSLEGTGLVTQRDLVWNALRMRPDRIIIGEVRGAEAFDMLQAMNTGHDGSISTLHANSARDALSRVENMVMMGHVNLPTRAIRSQIVSALDLIIQVERMRDGVRRVTQITEICNLEGDVITMNDVVRFEFGGEDAQGRLSGKYVSMNAVSAFVDRLEYFGFDRAWKDALQEI